MSCRTLSTPSLLLMVYNGHWSSNNPRGEETSSTSPFFPSHSNIYVKQSSLSCCSHHPLGNSTIQAQRGLKASVNTLTPSISHSTPRSQPSSSIPLNIPNLLTDHSGSYPPSLWMILPESSSHSIVNNSFSVLTTNRDYISPSKSTSSKIHKKRNRNNNNN